MSALRSFALNGFMFRSPALRTCLPSKPSTLQRWASSSATVRAEAGLTAGYQNLQPELTNPPVRLITLEEHFMIPALQEAIPSELLPPSFARPSSFLNDYAYPRLPDIAGQGRIDDMDAAGITIQVLSLGGVGAQDIRGHYGIPFAKNVNNTLSKAVHESPQPERFRCFAHLPMQTPSEAANELQRCVQELGFVGAMTYGQAGGKFLDDQSYDSLLAMAQQLDVPIYIHPGDPPEELMKTYYEGLPNDMGGILATGGFGWHHEVAIQLIRMACAGTFEKFPRLKLITGHQGELLPTMLQRLDYLYPKTVLCHQRSMAQTFREQLHVTFSGMYNVPAVMAAIQTFGVERVMWSVDYPYLPTEPTPGFLRVLNDVMAPADLLKVAQTNAEKLLRI
ncbi:hypothetical protein MMC18_002837 [Xylographa bjoerkii]|nr:hypothetical protein [Xylographa bjoerkii]